MKHTCECGFESKSARGLKIHQHSHEDDYKGEIKVLGRTYKAQGASPQEVIENFKISGGAKGMSVLKISKGKKSREKILNSIQTARLFAPASALTKEIVFKQVSEMFDL